ncbi:Putative uncharacterized protein [Lactococcus lactis subsp. lactis A12]|uniref:Uncharacterized protein n=1 Tax=Lactococcus lactis subsp. lactis A12 TaxID=1137134 RepID=S6FE31_LACLL|nr:Putative uncharacterized protein [Lactococcus lactis subsp. lactis A12]
MSKERKFSFLTKAHLKIH